MALYSGSQVFGSSGSSLGTSRTQAAGITNSSPQILDLTRPGSLLGPTTTGSGHYSPTPASASTGVIGVPSGVLAASSNSSQSSSSKLDKQSSKIEQTEPMDFSSSQPMSFSSRGFDASSFGRSTGPADLARFRTPASK